MAFTVEKHEKYPALIATWLADFDAARDAENYSDEVHRYLEAQTNPVYYVMNMLPAQHLTMEGIISGANLGARSGNSNFRHENTKAVIFVTDDEAIFAAAQGLRSKTFGEVNAFAYKSMDEALAHIQREG